MRIYTLSGAGRHLFQNGCSSIPKMDLKIKNLLPFTVDPFSEGSYKAMTIAPIKRPEVGSSLSA